MISSDKNVSEKEEFMQGVVREEVVYTKSSKTNIDINEEELGAQTKVLIPSLRSRRRCWYEHGRKFLLHDVLLKIFEEIPRYVRDVYSFLRIHWYPNEQIQWHRYQIGARVDPSE